MFSSLGDHSTFCLTAVNERKSFSYCVVGICRYTALDHLLWAKTVYIDVHVSLSSNGCPVSLLSFKEKGMCMDKWWVVWA